MANVREGHMPSFFIFSLDCAAPPLSCELVSNEMEMFSGLPGWGLFSAAQTMWLLRQWGCGLFMQHGSNSNSATVYLLTQSINITDFNHQSTQQLGDRPDRCVCSLIMKVEKL